jgi:hypothetical protein
MIKWKGAWLDTRGDVVTALDDVYTLADASDFFNVFRLATGVTATQARYSIGYLFGDLPTESRRRLQELFGFMHPFLGNKFDHTPEELLQLGIDAAKNLKSSEAKNLFMRPDSPWKF